MRIVTTISFVTTMFAVAAPIRAQTKPGGVDTIRVGSQPMRALAAGVDTFDIAFEARTATGGVDRRTNVSVVQRTTEQLDGVKVLHVRAGGPGGTYDYYLDARTLSNRRFEQHTPMDSAIVSMKNGCISGWAQLQNAPRRDIACEHTADRFVGGVVNADMVAALPLRAGFTATLATYSPMGGSEDYPFSVTGSDTLQLGDRRFATWRVERKVVSNYGTMTETLWVDQAKPRVLQADIDFGNGRKSHRVLRNR